MPDWLSSGLKEIAKRKVEALLVLLSPAVVAATEWGQSYLLQFVPEPSAVWALRAIALAIAAILLAVLSYIYFRPKFKLIYGVLWDNKDNVYCSSCKVILAPTNFDKEQWGHFINRSSFQCPKCQTMYLLKDETDRLISKQTCIEKIHAK